MFYEQNKNKNKNKKKSQQRQTNKKQTNTTYNKVSFLLKIHIKYHEKVATYCIIQNKAN